MRTWMLGAVPLWLSLSAAPVPASEHVLRITATILTRCSASDAVLRCTGADTRIAYRVATGADGIVTIEF